MSLPDTIASPLTSFSRSRLEKVLETELIAKYYEILLEISVIAEFGGTKQIGMYRCEESDLVHFYPSIVGSAALYKQLEQYPWYYLKEKKEFEIARQYINDCDSVLEVGCGEGFFANHVPRAKFTGLEFNPQAVVACHKKGLKVLDEPLGVHSRKNAGKYSVVCAFQVLEHVADPKAFLTDALACLQKNGILIVSVPAEDSYVQYTPNHILNMPPHHQTRWSDNALRSLGKYLPVSVLDIVHCQLEDIHVEHYCGVISEYMACNELKIDQLLIPLENYVQVREVATKFKPILAQKLLRGARPVGHDVVALYRKGNISE